VRIVEVAGYTRVLSAGHGALLVWGSLAAAVMLVGTRWATLRSTHRLGDALGEVNWSFSKSWASTLTAGGALLGTILSTTAVIPKSTKLLSSAAFAGLNLLFGFIILVAPLLFSAFARASATKADDGEPSYTGHVWTFLLACLLTLWAVIGEIVTISILLEELTAGALSGSLSWLFLVLLGILAILLAIYAWGTIRATICYKDEQAMTVAGTQITRRRSWSLL
jgi:hypothetical protein